ncbi:MAG TPA: GNAT family N-acetyltransferase [Acidimicrobiales bacterium]|nr:GNAT family N-acetyltransferase [Acidimicrobiales bacterium]
MRVRLAGSGDAEAIRSIYNHEVTRGTATFDLVPRTAEEQRAWLGRHDGAHPAVVAVEPAGGAEGPAGAGGEVVLGFGSLSPFRSRPAYATSVEDSVYVAGRHQGRGVGRALLDELVRLAAVHGFHTVIARIVGENEPSIALHRACGFETVGVEREVGRKHGRWLDVVEMQRML